MNDKFELTFSAGALQTYTSATSLEGLQGVQTLSVQSNLQILPLQNWPNFDNLGSNLPQDHCNLPSIVDSCENSIISL